MKKGYLKAKLGGIPNDWKEKLMPEVSWFQEGPGLRKWQFKDEGIKVINITNMVNGILDLSRTTRHISIQEFNKTYKHFECDEDDIVIASSGNSYCKHAIVRKQDLPLVMNTSVIRFKPLSDIIYDYLNQFLKSSLFKEQIDFMITGGAQPNFGPIHLNKVVLALPPLPEQQKIAEILSTVDAKIEIIDQQISETSELKKGLMQRLLTKGIGHTKFKDSVLGEIPESWEVVKLGKLGDFFKGRGISKSEILSEGEFPCLRYGEIYTIYDTIIYEFKSYINQASADKSVSFNSGDLLFTGSGETIGDIGKCVTYIGNDKPYAGGDLIIHRPTKGDSKYLSYYMNSMMINEQTRKMGQGNAVVHIYEKHLTKLILAFPPIKEQQQIAEILTSVDDKLQVLSEKKVTYQELKQGLMQQLLTGKVRVKV